MSVDYTVEKSLPTQVLVGRFTVFIGRLSVELLLWSLFLMSICASC